jgi:anti-sigma regulatory factor (Ser/Thr protein kinase)
LSRPPERTAAAFSSRTVIVRRGTLTCVRPPCGFAECDEDTADDLVLATSEALENCLDHAFVSAPAPGTMSGGAEFMHGAVIMVVTDDGTWRPPDNDPGHRGRGSLSSPSGSMT